MFFNHVNGEYRLDEKSKLNEHLFVTVKRSALLVLACTILTAGAYSDPSLSQQSGFDCLEQAIENLQSSFGQAYPESEKFLNQLADIRTSGDETKFAQLQRRALLANPLLGHQPILFIVRAQYVNEHGTEATMYQAGQVNTHCFRGGSSIKLLDAASGKVTTLLHVPEGIARDPEVHFDGGKILFSMRRNIKDDYHLYEIDSDGGNLRQLTFAAGVSDIQPVYMPEGSIIFSSTRDPKYIPCQRHLMANLFRMNGDGSNIRQIGYNTQFEGRASLMPDGRILYSRWEYVDKHFSSAYGLWTARPDGTDHALYYGNYAWQPSAISDGRIIPGTENFVATFTSAHDLGWGALVIGDRSKGLDGMEPILKSWPDDISGYMRHWQTEERIGGEYDSFMRVPIKYEDPYPLSREYFLCSRQLSPNDRMGIFLLDVFGNEVLLHEEQPGCFDPMPLARRQRPPVIPSQVDYSLKEGAFYVQDVYDGDYMDRVKRGSVKYLRVVEAPAKLAWVPNGMGDWAPAGSGDSHHPVALNWNHYNNKRILGTVPVEDDGSVYFRAPAGKFLYFQLLDANGMMIHSMRSGTMLQPGETKGCTGCHDNSHKAATTSNNYLAALQRTPTELSGWYGKARNFSYAKEVQPVLDKYCVDCHDYGKKAPQLNLSGDKGVIFNHSYTNLMRLSPAAYIRAGHENNDKLPLISSVGAGPVKIIPPYSWGSQRSRLVRMLQKGHGDVKLDRESFDRIVTWIDLNTPYYPSHISYYMDNTSGRSPLNHKELLELGMLVKQAPSGAGLGWDKVNEYVCNQIAWVMTTAGPPVNFTRPDRSACLKAFADTNSPGYRRALELIQIGAKNLLLHPRCDMEGFEPCLAHRDQLEFLRHRQDIELLNRRAIVDGSKVYDWRNGHIATEGIVSGK